MTYEQAVLTTWAPMQLTPRGRELGRFATLAANSHNSQLWLFGVAEKRISIAPDFARRCPAVDPDDHHLFASLGCAADNLVQAAGAMGLRATPVFDGLKVAIDLEAAPATRSPLFEAITHRQCTRAVYDGKEAASEALRQLESARREPGMSNITITDRGKLSSIIDYVLQGNSAQMQNKAFMDELRNWMRFSEADAVDKMEGLFSRASGNPALPSWMARPLLRLFFTEAGENKKYRKHIGSSAGIAVFSAQIDDKAHWVAAGRACQRLALQATALGLKYAFINQPVEVSLLRKQFASFLGLGDQRLDLVVRFGAGPELPKSLRRAPEQVIR